MSTGRLTSTASFVDEDREVFGQLLDLNTRLAAAGE
jgi:hypothetical protein